MIKVKKLMSQGLLLNLLIAVILVNTGMFLVYTTQINAKTVLKPTKTGGHLMIIKSAAFSNNEMIPSKYTCDSTNVSPPLVFEDVPANTKSLVLISDDPDAPVGTWVHWVVYNIPPETKSFKENLPTTINLPDGSVQGINDFHKIGYGGPCPPSGTHRYFFKLYALDTMLNLKPSASKVQVEAAMKGHVIAHTEIIGLYKRNR